MTTAEAKDVIRRIASRVGMMVAVTAANDANEETLRDWTDSGVPIPETYYNIKRACEELRKEHLHDKSN